MPRNHLLPKKVFIIGSGGLKIGQAGEFDYSGSQAIKALKEEGIATVLLNPNIATVQTDQSFADRVYFLPLTRHFAEQIIARERPDAILLNVGGQTALNLGLDLHRHGILSRYRVRVLGTPIAAIQDTEDRARFNRRLAVINLTTPRGATVTSLAEGLAWAATISYPVMVRMGFSLGGMGSGVARTPAELKGLLAGCLTQGPALVEEYLGGWKELEYEIMRDRAGNTVTICNMENMDPMGIHTGESIVVAPSQTLSNTEYHRLRSYAITAANHLGIIGECNIQFALEPTPTDRRNEPRVRVIEINARLSRSSALASKATGYPLALVATKVSLGHLLVDIPNAVTRATGSFFEPALDYIAVKIPRWDLTKFRAAETRIGSEMKSVGEVMALGRSFPEAIQKAVRMLGVGRDLTAHTGYHRAKDAMRDIANPTSTRLFALAEALQRGIPIDTLNHASGIDRWFLRELKSIADYYQQLMSLSWRSLASDTASLRAFKQMGFSDQDIARATGTNAATVRLTRRKKGIIPAVKQVDTTAGEFPAHTNYLYLTYHGTGHDLTPDPHGIIVLGSGPYRIGSSVEFDWCCVTTATALRAHGKHAIMINANPETVSTDYDMSDRLYFEELTLERVLDIHEFEHAHGVIVSMGGQTPNSLALGLADAQVTILGTAAAHIDRAEDRNKFSSLLDRLGVDQPVWRELTTARAACGFARRVGYPVLVRPSYVLSGAAMNVARDERELKHYLALAAAVSNEYPVVISKFIEHAKEVEIDGVAQDGELVLYAITEHVEDAGVHSGDATVVYPPQRLFLETTRRIKVITRDILRELSITGPFNIQFLVKDNRVQVIECNLRASRSFPFVSKVSKYNFIEIATRAMLGHDIRGDYRTLDLDYVAVKAPKYSFNRIKGADPRPSVEMTSTGEVACFGDSYEEAFLKAIMAAGNYYPKNTILLSIGPDPVKGELLDDIKRLAARGFRLAATTHTAQFLQKNGVKAILLYKKSERRSPNIAEWITTKKIDCVINIPNSRRTDHTMTDGYHLRRLAVDYHIPIHTDAKIAKLYLRAITQLREQDLHAKAWDEYSTRERWWKSENEPKKIP